MRARRAGSVSASSAASKCAVASAHSPRRWRTCPSRCSISPTPAGILSAGTKTATGLSYGLGLDYRLADQLRGGLEWVRYWDNIGINASGITSSKMTMDGYTATLKYLF